MPNKNVLVICLIFIVASSVVYEAQGTFLLKMYLRRKFSRSRDFTPFACNGMLFLMNRLRGGCPATREFKKFFSLFTSYVKFISNASATSKSIDTQIKSQVDGLANAMSELTAVKGRAPSNTDFRDTMLSMGKTMIDQKKGDSQRITLEQRKVLVAAMVKWSKTIAALVKTAVDLRVGKSMDISNLGLDVDVNSVVVGSGSDESPKSGSPGSDSDSPTTPSSGTDSITYKDTTGGGSDSPSGSPTGSTVGIGSERTQTGSPNTKTGGQSNASSGNVTTTISGSNTKTGSKSQIAVSSETGSSNIKNGSQNSGSSP